MGISIYKIKKWTNMLLGNSVHHVCQDEGKIYSVDEIRGYYNNLTEKVTRFGPATNEVPKTYVDTGEEIYFSIAVFQYGLGAYDLYLMNSDKTMLKKTVACAEWALQNQQEDGSYVTFAYKVPEHPYSSMAQAQAVSLFVRAYTETQNENYLNAAAKALDFMLKPIEDGGTTKYENENVYLYECTCEPLILNGWIFSLWGIFDYYKLTGNDDVKKILDATLKSLKNKLRDFDAKYWSNYDDCAKRISSPFYHKLHIAQLRVMYDLFGDAVYREYAEKWEQYENSFWKPKRAFVKKALQKLIER